MAKGRGKGKRRQKLTQSQVDEAIPLQAKAVSSCMQSDRDQEAVLFEVAMVDAQAAIPVKMREATKKWQEAMEEKGKGHNLGPPFLPAWEALLGSLLEEEIGAPNKTKLKELHSSMVELTMEEKLLHIRTCRPKKAYVRPGQAQARRRSTRSGGALQGVPGGGAQAGGCRGEAGEGATGRDGEGHPELDHSLEGV